MADILASSRTKDVLGELGKRIQRLRLDQNLRVEDLAKKAGVSHRTISRMESGTGVGIEHWIRVLRGLGRLQALESFLPLPTASPLQLVKTGGRMRRRASRSGNE